MFSHIFIGVTDFDRAFAFYSVLMDKLGIEDRFCDRSRLWAAWHSAGATRPFLIIGKPYDEKSHDPGNGQMVALLAEHRSIVDTAFQTALAHGGTSEGPPGLRPEYHQNYYGAYFRDPDGNKLCVVCHSAS
jgi:catechol 2,3-dioxygenase-like lactoylglutathione lyase family enzyme